MEQMQFSTLHLRRHALHENFSDQRCDVMDRARNRQHSDGLQAGVDKAGMNALTDGPYARLAWKRGERDRSKIRDVVIESTDESLVGSEHDGNGRSLISGILIASNAVGAVASLKQMPRPSSTVRT